MSIEKKNLIYGYFLKGREGGGKRGSSPFEYFYVLGME